MGRGDTTYYCLDIVLKASHLSDYLHCAGHCLDSVLYMRVEFVCDIIKTLFKYCAIMPGRHQDSIWYHFDKILQPGKTGCRAKCKSCSKDMQGIVSRMKQHYVACSLDSTDQDTSTPPPAALPSPTPPSSPTPATKRPASPPRSPSLLKRQRLDNFLVQTSASEKAALDQQCARFLFATNSSFNQVEHPEFTKLVSMLRPGYTPRSRHDVGNKHLDQVHESLESECREQLQDKPVCMSLDGWSNIHNEPIVCASVTDQEGHTFVTETVDTSGHSHCSEYLQEVAETAINNTERWYGCKVRSFVTDNAANMTKMRRQLAEDNELIISYGCSAHILNLLAKDVEISGVKEHVVHIVKYFRNTHLPAAWYKQAGGKKLVLPQDVRWNTLADCLKSYLDNWPLLVKVCDDNKKVIDSTIANKVKDLTLKGHAQDYLDRMTLIAIALVKSRVTLAASVMQWRFGRILSRILSLHSHSVSPRNFKTA